MSEAQHTPGNWTVDDEGNLIAHLPAKENKEREVYLLAKSVQGQTNGNLISAAPDLLLGCQESLKFLEAIGVAYPTNENLSEASCLKALLREVIAKAEGKVSARLKLSTAIREGAKLRPQGFRRYFTSSRGGLRSCALGAAFEHATGTAGDYIRVSFEMFEKQLRRKADCPVAGCAVNWGLGAIITHLNDDHRWTREQIADWVEQFEAKQEVSA